MIASLEDGLVVMRAKLAQVGGMNLWVIQFANALCLDTEKQSCTGVAYATLFSNPREAERLARQIKNGNGERPAAVPYELALKAAIERAEQTIATLTEWEKRGE